MFTIEQILEMKLGDVVQVGCVNMERVESGWLIRVGDAGVRLSRTADRSMDYANKLVRKHGFGY